MERDILQESGLSQAEATVYLALLEIGSTKSGTIIERAKLQPSVVFFTLHNLIEKGLVSTIKVGKHNKYTAAPPTAIRDLLDERRNRFEAALPALMAKRPLETPEGAEIYEGIAGLQAMFFSMIEDAQKGEEFLYFDAEEHGQEERAKLVYVPLHARFKQRGIIARGIQQSSTLTKSTYGKNVRLSLTQETIPPDTSIFRDKLALVTWSEIPRAVLITSKPLAEQYKRFWQGFYERTQTNGAARKLSP